MLTLHTFTTAEHTCGYLPAETARMRYQLMAEISAAEFEAKLIRGWRHFGRALFQPACPECSRCLSLRLDATAYRPNRSQRRAWDANRDVTLTIAEPEVTDEKLDLYDRFHVFQQGFKDWPRHGPKEEDSYIEGFVDNPFPVEEWQYRVGDKLIGVGYVDRLSKAMSAIYFFYDPDERDRSPGTFNVMSILADARRNGIPYVYMGYYVAECRSLAYKANFLPNQVIGPSGRWIDFRLPSRQSGTGDVT